MSADEARFESITQELITARTAIGSLRNRIVDLETAAFEDRADLDRFRNFILANLPPSTEYPRSETANEIVLRLERAPRAYAADPHRVVRERNPYPYFPADSAGTSDAAPPPGTLAITDGATLQNPDNSPSSATNSVRSDSSTSTVSVRPVPPPPPIGTLVYVVGGKKIARLKGVPHLVLGRIGKSYSSVRRSDDPTETPRKRKSSCLEVISFP